MGLFQPARTFIRFYLDILNSRQAFRDLLLMFLGLGMGWWVYVPLHELLHVAGCLIGGGEVWELEIKAMYGGNLLSHVFPFVSSGSDYAGRLSGFDTHGSDAVYALLVFFPFLISLFGFMFLEMTVRRNNPFLFGLVLPVVFAPIISLTGDFLELGSLLLYQFWPGSSLMNRALISDDLFLLLSQMGTSPVPSGLPAYGFVSLSMILATAMAWGTIMLSHIMSQAVFRPKRPK